MKKDVGDAVGIAVEGLAGDDGTVIPVVGGGIGGILGIAVVAEAIGIGGHGDDRANLAPEPSRNREIG